jgi:hypothetical protein
MITPLALPQATTDVPPNGDGYRGENADAYCSLETVSRNLAGCQLF